MIGLYFSSQQSCIDEMNFWQQQKSNYTKSITDIFIRAKATKAMTRLAQELQVYD